MICPKCHNNLEPGAKFCTICGERLDTVIQQGKVKPRKEYNTTAYILLDLFAGGLYLGINDFYAGYITAGLIRLLSSVIGFTLVMTTSNLFFFFFLGLSVLMGFIELFLVHDKAYATNRGTVFIRPLDMLYDRKGTELLLKTKYGYEFSPKVRKEFNTAVYIIIWFVFGGVIPFNDFYAGYYKAASIRLAAVILGIILGAATNVDIIIIIFAGMSIVVGIIELVKVKEKQYTLANGNLVLVRPLDIMYEREATENMLIQKYGCGLAK